MKKRNSKNELTSDDLNLISVLDSSITEMWNRETYIDEKYDDFLYEAFNGNSISMAFVDRRTHQAYAVDYIPVNYPAWSCGNIPSGNSLLRILENLSRGGWSIRLKGILWEETLKYFELTEEQVRVASQQSDDED